MTWTDAVGAEHERACDEPRIVSLVPSLTETLFEIGLGPRVVGRTKWCIHPKGRVEAAVSLGGTKKINLDRFRAMEPTHVVVNIDENPKEMVEALQAMGTEALVTHPIDARDNGDVFALLGGVFGREEEAQRLRDSIDQELQSIESTDFATRNVLYFIWKNPWMTVSHDTYISRMLGLVGWKTLGHDAAERYPRVDLTPALIEEADLILFSSEPYRFSDDDLKTFAREFDCPADKLRLVDGEMTSWYGSRAIQGLRYLSRIAREWT